MGGKNGNTKADSNNKTLTLSINALYTAAHRLAHGHTLATHTHAHICTCIRAHVCYFVLLIPMLGGFGAQVAPGVGEQTHIHHLYCRRWLRRSLPRLPYVCVSEGVGYTGRVKMCTCEDMHKPPTFQIPYSRHGRVL